MDGSLFLFLFFFHPFHIFFSFPLFYAGAIFTLLRCLALPFLNLNGQKKNTNHFLTSFPSQVVEDNLLLGCLPDHIYNISEVFLLLLLLELCRRSLLFLPFFSLSSSATYTTTSRLCPSSSCRVFWWPEGPPPPLSYFAVWQLPAWLHPPLEVYLLP